MLLEIFKERVFTITLGTTDNEKGISLRRDSSFRLNNEKIKHVVLLVNLNTGDKQRLEN